MFNQVVNYLNSLLKPQVPTKSTGNIGVGQNIPYNVPAYNNTRTVTAPSTGGATSSWGTPTTLGANNTYSNPGTPSNNNNNSNNNNVSASTYSSPSINYDGVFNPLLDNLSAQEATARAEQDMAINQVNQVADKQREYLKEEDQLAQNKFTGEVEKADKSKESALGQAVKYFNALQQQARSRFGGGSSAGQAVSELNNQTFLENQGKVQEDYDAIYGKLLDQRDQVSRYVFKKKDEIDTYVKDSIENVQLQFRKVQDEIAANKNLLQVQKAQMVINELTKARDFMSQIQAQKEQANTQLDTWKQQQMFMIQNGLANIYSNPIATNVSAPTQATVNANQQSDNGALKNIRWNPSTQRFEDELGNVVN